LGVLLKKSSNISQKTPPIFTFRILGGVCHAEGRVGENNLNTMGKKYLFGIIGILLIIAIATILIFAVDWADVKMKKEIRETTAEQEIVKAQATEALKSVVDVANELSGITSGTVFNFEVDDLDGRAANFGIVQWVDDVKGERIAEEHVVTFRELDDPPVTFTSGGAEVDRETNIVVAMHRTPVIFGDPLPVDLLETIVRQFVERVYPEFASIESTLVFDPGSKSAQGRPTNHFFRWNDRRFAVPSALSMDSPPFIQVGINSHGFIFSYDNTFHLYHNLSKEALRALCGFVEIPKTDDSSIDQEKVIVKVWFTQYEPFQNRYLVLPYEPEIDFEGCSESAKAYLRHLPTGQDKN